MKPEAKIVKNIRLALKEKYGDNCRSIKIHGNPFQEVGIPDLLCCIYGIFVGMEVKQPGKGATEVQFAFGRSIEKAGGVWGVVDTVSDALKLASLAEKRVKSLND